MEINDKPVQNPRPSSRVSGDLPIDITRPMREGIQKFRDTFEPKVLEDAATRARTAQRAADRIEVSEEARRLAAAEGDGATEDITDTRRTRLEELRAALLEGRLHTPERIERAAERMLGAE